MPMDNRLMVPRRNYDADALRYLNAVQLADGQALEPEIQAAVDAFVRGCKADGIWDAIKASCILCGARTISGALVPLAGAAPTPYNFASGDYSRTTGLKGDGATKYLDSNRANDADGQDDNHNAVYATTRTGSSSGANTYPVYIGTSAATGSNNIGRILAGSDNFFVRIRSLSSTLVAGASTVAGFIGIRRSQPDAFFFRASGVSASHEVLSQTPSSLSIGVFKATTDAFTYADARLAFYSIGSSLDLAALDNRVSTLVAAIAAAL